MKQKYYFAMLAAVVLTACTSENDMLEAPPKPIAEEVQQPIMFSSSKSATTRADIEGAAAAELLGNKFVVFGYKGASSGTPDWI